MIPHEATVTELETEVRQAADHVSRFLLGLPQGHPLRHQGDGVLEALYNLGHLTHYANDTYKAQVPE